MLVILVQWFENLARNNDLNQFFFSRKIFELAVLGFGFAIGSRINFVIFVLLFIYFFNFKENIDYKKSVTGVAYSKDESKITIIGVEDKPGVAANLFEPLNNAQINVDMVIQNISVDQKTTDITFTVKRDDLLKTIDTIENNKKIQYKSLTHNDKVSKISIVGAGMVSTPGVTYRMFKGLAEEKINILAISTSEIKLSVIINEKDTLLAVRKLHTIFDLD